MCLAVENKVGTHDENGLGGTIFSLYHGASNLTEQLDWRAVESGLWQIHMGNIPTGVSANSTNGNLIIDEGLGMSTVWVLQ